MSHDEFLVCFFSTRLLLVYKNYCVQNYNDRALAGGVACVQLLFSPCPGSEFHFKATQSRRCVYLCVCVVARGAWLC